MGRYLLFHAPSSTFLVLLLPIPTYLSFPCLLFSTSSHACPCFFHECWWRKKEDCFFSPCWPFAFPPPLPPTLRLLQRLTKGILIYCRSRRRRRRRGRVCKKAPNKDEKRFPNRFLALPSGFLKTCISTVLISGVTLLQVIWPKSRLLAKIFILEGAPSRAIV